MLASWCTGATLAQDVGGTIYEDRDADGIRDAGEPALDGIAVRLYGESNGSGSVDQTVLTPTGGSYLFSPGNGCYVVRPSDPAGWRLGPARRDVVAQGSPGFSQPVGLDRHAALENGIGNLAAGTVRYSALGDSIATNFNFCELLNLFGSFQYSEDFRDRLRCVAPAASVTLDQWAVKGEHTDDLLVNDGGGNNVFQILSVAPEIVSISMIGNDLLGVDVDNPTQNDINIATEEVIDSRQNLQEAISSMIAEVPGLDVMLNTLYDNRADGCYGAVPTTTFHREWIPIINQMLRDMAWGQARRVSINEVFAEFGQEDLNNQCFGFGSLICQASGDGIHPVQSGYDVVREALWEAGGGVSLGSGDALGRTTRPAVDFGYLKRVRRLWPTTFQALGGASVTTPEAALDGADGDAVASVALGVGSEEFRVADFPDFYDEIRIAKVVAGVRYRTSGTFQDDLYRVEASLQGTFRAPPGHDFTPTDWDYFTPLVGAGGPNAPAVRPDYPASQLLVSPSVATLRDVSATLTKDAVLDAGSGEYRWPAITHEELANAAMRVVAAPIGTTAGTNGRVEVESLWLDLYGHELPRPAEVTALLVDARLDGGLDLSFDELAGAARYNVYAGRLSALPAAGYDHGDGAPRAPDCDATTASGGPGRRVSTIPQAEVPAENVYFLVTAHDADDVESPSGFDWLGNEIARSESDCR